MKNCGQTNRLSLSGMDTIKTFLFLEQLYRKRIITNYTDDGWVLANDEWQPAQIFVNNYGDDLTNEYSRACGQADLVRHAD